MRVTPFRLKLWAVYHTLRLAPMIIRVELRVVYLKFYHELLRAYWKNPRIKW